MTERDDSPKSTGDWDPELAGDGSTPRQQAYLRGVGQRMEASLKIGKEGLLPVFFAELRRHFAGRELVKLKFLVAERDERAALSRRIAEEGGCTCVGSVGRTALFYRPKAGATR